MSSRARLLSRLSPFATALALLAAPRAPAQTTITFTNGQTNSTAVDTSAPNSPTTLALASGTATQSGVLSGTGSVLKTGAGNLTLAGANTYTGTTTVSAGTLAFSLAPVGNIVNNASLSITAGNYGGVISGTGSVTLGSIGTLSGANTYTGPTNIIPAGYVQLSASDRLPTGTALTLGFESALYLQNFNQTLGSLAGSGDVYLDSGTLTVGSDNTSTTFSGGLKRTGAASGTFVKTGTGTLFFSLPTGNSFPRSSFDGNITINGGLINFAALGDFGNSPSTLTLNGGGLQWATGSTADPSAKFTPLGANGGTFDTNGNNVTFASALSGAGGLTKSGVGSLTLNAANTYSGGTTVTGGLIHFSSLANLGSGSVTLNGGGLRWATGNTADVSSRLAALGANGGTFDTNGNNVTFASAFSGPGALIKAGAGKLTLNATNTYSGGTTVTGGLVNFSSLANLGSGTVTLNGGGLQWAAGNTVDITSRLAALGANGGTFDTNSNNVAFASALSGTGALTKAGAGRLTLSAANTYTGATTVSAGNLTLGANDVLPNTSAVTVSSGATLALAGFSATIGSLAGGGSVTLGSGTLTTGGDNSSTNFPGVISGTGGLTKIGSGTFTLGDINTYTGTTTVSAGTLAFDFAPVGNIVNHAALKIVNAADYGGVISGTGSVTLGSVTLSGANTYTGPTNILPAAYVQLTASDRLPTGTALTVGFDGTLDLQTYNQTLGSLAGSGDVYLDSGTLTVGSDNTSTTFSGGLKKAGATSGTFVKTGTGTLFFSLPTGNSFPRSSFTGNINITGGLINFAAIGDFGNSASTITLNGGGLQWATGSTADPSAKFTPLGVNGGTFDTNGNNVTFASAISGTGGLTKAGSGSLTLAGGNTYTGTTNIAEGTLIFGGTTNSTYSGRITGPGSIIKSGSGTTTLTGDVYNIGPQGTFTISSGALRLTDQTGLFLYDLINNGTVIFDNNTTNTFTQKITGTGSVTKTGSGTFTLTGNNAYSGGTTINAGTLALSSSSGNTLGTGPLAITTGGHLTSTQTLTLDSSLSVDGTGSSVTTSSSLGLRSSSSITNGGHVTSGPLTLGASGFAPPTLTVTGANSVLHVDGQIALFNNGALSIADSATLQVGGGDGIRSFGGAPLNLAGSTLQVSGSDLTTAIPATLTGNATVNTNGLNATLSGVLSGTGTILKTGAGTLTLSGANTYAGTTTVSAGTLALGASDALPSSGTLSVANGATFDVAGFTATLSSLSGPGNVTLGSGTLSLGAGDTSSTFVGLISGTGSLVKVGTGTLTLSRVSSYSGGTTVSAGTLLFPFTVFGTLAGNITNHGAVEFASSTLTYTGGISGSGSVIISGIGPLTLTGAHTYTGTTTLTGTSSAITLGASDRLPAQTALTLADFSSLNLANFNQTLGSLASSGVSFVKLGSGTLTVGTANTSTTFAGTIRDSGSLVKTGTGTLTLAGTNTYTGGTLITGGLINLNNSGASLGTGSHNVTLNGGGLQWATGTSYDLSEQLAPIGTAGATFDTNGNNVTFTQSPLTGSGGLIKTGAGTLTLAAGATYTGNTTISSGTLGLGGGTSLSGDITGPGALVKTGTGTAALTGTTVTPAGGITVAEGTLVFGLGDRPFFSVPVVNHASLVFDSIGSGFFNSVISGTGSVTKTGSGSFSLNPANTYSGGTTVAAGTLEASGSFSELGTGDIAITTGGQLNGGTSLNRALTVDGAGSRFATSSLRIGEASPGTVAVTNQGSVNTTSTVLVGYGNTGSLSVTGGGNVSTGFTTVGYAFSGPSGSVPGTGTLTLADGGRFSSSNDLLIGRASTGTVSVTGLSSTLTVATLLDLAITGGTGTLTIGAGGTVSAGSLNLGHFSNDSATLNLATGGTLRVGGTVTGSLSPSSVFNFAGGTWQVTGSALSTALPLTLTNTSTLDTNGLNASLTGVLSGSGALTKTGTGTLTLAAANTYTGGTAITGGLVNFSSSANFGTGSVTLDGGGLQWATGTSTDFSPRLAPLGAGGATFATNGNAVTFATALSGPGGLTKSGAGTLTLTAANTYTGPTTVSAGTLAFGANQAIPAASTVTVGAGATLDLVSFSATLNSLGGTGTVSLGSGTLTTGGANATTWAGVFSGPGSLIKTGTGSLTLTSANTLTGATTISAGTLILANGGSIGPVTNNATLTFDRTDTSTFSGTISGTGALTKTGAGTVTLSGANTYTGPTSINTGTLAISSASNLGTGAIAVSTGGRLDGGSSNLSFNRAVTVDGSGSTLATTGYLEFGNPTNGSLALTGGATASATASIAFGVVGGTGTGSVTGTGSTLTANSLFIGALAGSGTFSVGTGGNATANTVLFGVGGGTGTLNVNSGGTLRVGGTDGIVNSGGTATVNLAGGTLQVNGSALTTSVPATLSNSTTIDTNGLGATFSGSLSGSGALVKSGSGTLTLSGANTYTGATTVSTGTLALSSAGNLGTGSVAVTTGGRLDGGSSNLSFNRIVTVDGSGSTLATTGYLEFGSPGAGSLALTGGATASASASIAFGVNFGSGTGSVSGTGSTLTTNSLFIGALGGSGTFSVGAGATATASTVLFGVGGGTGTLNVNSGGTLRVGGTDGIVNSGGTATVNLAGGTLQVNGSALTTSVPATLSNSSTIHTNALAATFSGPLSGSGSLTKIGSGTLTFSAANTYSGTTTVSAGTLHLTGSALSSAFTVNSGATLSGTGSLGALTLAGTVSPGSSPGTLSAGNTTFASGGSYTWEINNATGVSGINYDLLSITGSLAITATAGSPFAINVTSLLANNTAGPVINFNSTQNYSYTIATTTSGITGFSPSAFTLDSTGFTNAANGGTWSLAQSGNNLNLNFTASAIPEPSTYAAIFGACALALAAYRRRQTRSRSS